MLDVLMPCPVSNLSLCRQSIDRIFLHTKIPFNLTVIVDGGSRSDLSDLEVVLHDVESPWRLLHNIQPVGLNQSLQEGLEECRHKIVAVIGPEVIIDDAKWMAKVDSVYSKDPICGVLDMWPNTKSSTLFPIKRAQNNPVPDGCRFAVLQTAFVKKMQPFGMVDPINYWSRMALSGGGSSWALPGVRYSEAPHEEHELWFAPLAHQVRSGSR